MRQAHVCAGMERLAEKRKEELEWDKEGFYRFYTLGPLDGVFLGILGMGDGFDDEWNGKWFLAINGEEYRIRVIYCPYCGELLDKSQDKGVV